MQRSFPNTHTLSQLNHPLTLAASSLLTFLSRLAPAVFVALAASSLSLIFFLASPTASSLPQTSPHSSPSFRASPVSLPLLVSLSHRLSPLGHTYLLAASAAVLAAFAAVLAAVTFSDTLSLLSRARPLPMCNI
jgi:hypothetical protein